jgi:flagellar biogenesis protein FliO
MNGLTYEALALNRTPVATFGYIVQVAISLAIVLGLIYLTSRYILPRLQVNPKGKLLEVLDRVGLEPQVTAYVLKFKKNIYVVGVSNKNVSLIDKQKEGEES